MVPLLSFILACNLVTLLPSPSLSTTANLTDQALPPSPGISAACIAMLPDILKAGTAYGSAVNLPSIFGSDQEVHYLVLYAVQHEKLGKRENLLLPDKLDKKLDARATHEAIWHTFTALIPAVDRSFVTEFAVLSDGSSNVLAGVSPTYDNPQQWTLKVDVADAVDPYSLEYSLLHEYGHLLTLNASQVPPDAQVFYHPGDKAIYKNALGSCPSYFTGEGCSNSTSYMNQFFSRYWSNLYAEWQKTEGQDSPQELMYDFYNAHADQFLTSYAATSPEEDIAESWAFFVLSPKPEPTSIANQKILFFYEYPELAALRHEILQRLCSSFPGN